MTSRNNKLFNYEMKMYLILKIILRKEFDKNFEFKYSNLIQVIIRNIVMVDDEIE